MPERTCPVDGAPLPPYTFGRPRVYCSVDCRRKVEDLRGGDLARQRHRVETAEARVKQARASRKDYFRPFVRKEREELAKLEGILEAADRLTRP